jgi:hypothetical protein
MRIGVLHPLYDKIEFFCTKPQAARMLELNQVVVAGRNLLRLTTIGTYHRMRTKTTRSRFHAAIGKGQCYTADQPLDGHVEGQWSKIAGFVPIYPEDAAVFRQATLNTGGRKCEFEFSVT